jgi:hypothetical protein
MTRCLFCGSLRDSYPSTASEYAWSLVNRVDLLRSLFMAPLPHIAQISPDKDVLARRSASARRRELSVHKRRIYLVSRTCGLCCVVPTRPETKPYMRFLFVVSHVCHRASFGPLLAETPLPSARTFGSIH